MFLHILNWMLTYFSIFQKCAERSTPKYVANWSDVFSYYPARIEDFINSAAGETRLNYEKFYYMLKSKNINLILMQYPKCSIQFLKNIFSPHQQDKITFVENFNNFSKELATKRWLRRGFYCFDDCFAIMKRP